jgi:peptide/nickel transport system ATP-binding protein
MMAPQALVEVRDLAVDYERGGETIRTVHGVSFRIAAGESYGLVGESGSGKTTTARAILGLTKVAAGEVLLAGQPIQGLSRRKMRPLRQQMQLIYQDPQSSLDPRMSIRSLVEEPLKIWRFAGGAGSRNRVRELLDQVGLGGDVLAKRPGALSGGQLQRVAIARALAVGPRILVCDEVVSSLDVSVQAQILNLLKNLQQQLGLTILFISHDLGVIRYMCDSMAVMYQGRIVESGPTSEIVSSPADPYTQRLLEACPDIDDVAKADAAARSAMTPARDLMRNT